MQVEPACPVCSKTFEAPQGLGGHLAHSQDPAHRAHYRDHGEPTPPAATIGRTRPAVPEPEVMLVEFEPPVDAGPLKPETGPEPTLTAASEPTPAAPAGEPLALPESRPVALLPTRVPARPGLAATTPPHGHQTRLDDGHQAPDPHQAGSTTAQPAPVPEAESLWGPALGLLGGGIALAALVARNRGARAPPPAPAPKPAPMQGTGDPLYDAVRYSGIPLSAAARRKAAQLDAAQEALRRSGWSVL